MFEKIVLRRSDKGPALSAGELAEALLFYQNVHIILDDGSLRGLVCQIGMPTLVSLLSRPNISAVYCEESLGVHTETTADGSKHSFIAFSFEGNKEVGHLSGRKKKLELVLSKLGYEKKQARRLVERFRKNVPVRKLTSDHFIEGGILESARMDLFDSDYVHQATRFALADMVGVENAPPTFHLMYCQMISHFA
jgi:hypothetical protein